MEPPVNTAPPAKRGLTFYVGIAIVVLTVASFAVEALVAFKEGRSMNLELINKVLDTLLALMGSPSVSE
ncbi:hypothetical protein D3C76_37190 [compost metagenome]